MNTPGEISCHSSSWASNASRSAVAAVCFAILYLPIAVLTVYSMVVYLRAAWPFMKEDHQIGG